MELCTFIHERHQHVLFCHMNVYVRLRTSLMMMMMMTMMTLCLDLRAYQKSVQSNTEHINNGVRSGTRHANCNNKVGQVKVFNYWNIYTRVDAAYQVMMISLQNFAILRQLEYTHIYIKQHNLTAILAYATSTGDMTAAATLAKTSRELKIGWQNSWRTLLYHNSDCDLCVTKY